jgi:hypothetical protein
VSPRRINEIVQGKRGITADTAAEAREIFRHRSAVLDEPAVAPRPGGRKGRNRGQARARG